MFIMMECIAWLLSPPIAPNPSCKITKFSPITYECGQIRSRCFPLPNFIVNFVEKYCASNLFYFSGD